MTDKCTWCYHRITKGLQPACVEVCPVGARIFGDLHDKQSPVSQFIRNNRTRVLKPESGNAPNVYLRRPRQGRDLMEPVANIAPFIGYVYPNETVIPWTVLVVVYPYLTGLVAGAFTVSSLYQVFGMQRFKPVAHLALLTSLCCMLVVPMPLLLHLGHPERALNAMITPHTTSAFAIFGYAASFYVLLLLLENWFVFRPHIVREAQRTKGALRLFYRVLSLGSDDLSEKAMSYDRKWIFALAVIGIPAAHGLHGYVGFVFGSLKSREWWSSDLMPAIFLFSAIISGTALLIVHLRDHLPAAQGAGRPALPQGHGVYAVGIHDVHAAARGRGVRKPRLPGPRRDRDDPGVRQGSAHRPVRHPAVRRRLGRAARRAHVHDLARHRRQDADRGRRSSAHAWCCSRC